jgi:hypothetical protein
MKKKSTKAAKKRTPPAMPTPSPTLRPVLEELDDDWVAPLSRGEPEFEEDVGETAEEMVEPDPALVEPPKVVVVGLVLLVDDGDEEVEAIDIVTVDATYSTAVGTEAEKSADVVGV